MNKYTEILSTPRQVEAMKIETWSMKEVQEFCPSASYLQDNKNELKIVQVSVRDNKGYIRIGNEGDYLVKDANGHFTIMEWSEFTATFRPMEEE